MKMLSLVFLFLLMGRVSYGNIPLQKEDFRLIKPKPPPIVEEDVELQIHPNCVVIINGKRATVNDIHEGMDVRITTDDNNLIIRIEATRKE